MGVTDERWLTLAPVRCLEGVSPAEVRDACLRAMAPPVAAAAGGHHPHHADLADGGRRRGRAGRAAHPARAGPTFRGLTAGIDDRLALVVHFLAVLELVKQGLADVEQATTFGDIVVIMDRRRRGCSPLVRLPWPAPTHTKAEEPER